MYFTTPGAVLRCAKGGCGGTPTTIASLQINPARIVTNGTDVFYATDTAIMQCSVSGCGSSPITIATVSSGPIDLASDGVNLYWTNGVDTVLACPLAGCGGPPQVLASGQSAPYGLSTDGTYVYWLSGQLLAQCATAGCGSAPTIIGAGGSGSWTFATESHVYWGDEVTIRRCSSGGCNGMPNQVVSGAGFYPRVVASDATGFYYLNSGALQKCPPCGCNGAPIERDWLSSNLSADVVTDGATAYWIANDQHNIYSCVIADCVNTLALFSAQGSAISSLMLHGSDLYFFRGGYPDSGGDLVRCPTTSSPDANCSAISSGAARPSGLTSDGTYLYWISGGVISNGQFVNGGVIRMPVGGGPTLALASGLPGIGAASAVWDGQFIYFAGFFNGTIYRIPVAGGALVPLATGQSYPSSLVLDGTKLFWGTDSQILSLDLSADGGAPTPIAESPQAPFVFDASYFAPPRRIAVDNGFLYWVTMSGGGYNDSVSRVPLLGGSPVSLVSSQGALAGGIAIASGSVLFSGTSPTLMSVDK